MSRHDPAVIAANLAEIRARIEAVERGWDHDVEITAVTKAFGPDLIPAAVAGGCRVIGENYAQELLSKRSVIEATDPPVRVDFIGRLQSNKVRQIADLVDRWCTVERFSIATEIAKRAPGAEVLVQVNSTAEPNKGGCAPGDVGELVEHCRRLDLSVSGLLTIGPTDRPPAAAEAGFRMVRTMVDEMGLDVCSMGMTADLEVAVACGSTNVRIGSALFGARPSSSAEIPVHHEEGASG